jgi:hypothetical protein
MRETVECVLGSGEQDAAVHGAFLTDGPAL